MAALLTSPSMLLLLRRNRPNSIRQILPAIGQPNFTQIRAKDSVDSAKVPGTNFDKILSYEMPSHIVCEDEHVLAFRAINPQAPTHVLVVPKPKPKPKPKDGLTELLKEPLPKQLTELGKAGTEHKGILGHLLYVSKIVAEKEGIVKGGFRVVINSGDNACQYVNHLHLHVLGGEKLKSVYQKSSKWSLNWKRSTFSGASAKTAGTNFDKILSKEMPSHIVHEDKYVLAFRDFYPQAPTHVLVVPKPKPKPKDGLTELLMEPLTEPLKELGKAGTEHEGILGHLLYVSKIVAEKEGIVDDGFRVVINSGRNACQAVSHLHLHVLGGKKLKSVY